jgi:Zn-dependent protease
MMVLLRGDIDFVWVLMLVFAWFVQMGLHEGGHAWVADRLGDPMPRMYGRVTCNPLRHIEWNNLSYVFGAVLLPIATALMGWLPMGMAYVMVSGNHTTANRAKIALAGPVGSFLAAGIGVAIWFVCFPLARHMPAEVAVRTFQLCLALVVVSVLYGAFNLFPVPPLDGGDILYHFMNHDGRRMMNQIRPYGFFLIMGVFWLMPMLSGGRLDIGDVLFDPIQRAGVWLLTDLPTMVWGSRTA